MDGLAWGLVPRIREWKTPLQSGSRSRFIMDGAQPNSLILRAGHVAPLHFIKRPDRTGLA